MRTGRTRLWPHFKYVYQTAEGKFYRCVHCGEIVHSHERRHHLRYHHPEIFENLKGWDNNPGRDLSPAGVLVEGN